MFVGSQAGRRQHSKRLVRSGRLLATASRACLIGVRRAARGGSLDYTRGMVVSSKWLRGLGLVVAASGLLGVGCGGAQGKSPKVGVASVSPAAPPALRPPQDTRVLLDREWDYLAEIRAAELRGEGGSADLRWMLPEVLSLVEAQGQAALPPGVVEALATQASQAWVVGLRDPAASPPLALLLGKWQHGELEALIAAAGQGPAQEEARHGVAVWHNEAFAGADVKRELRVLSRPERVRAALDELQRLAELRDEPAYALPADARGRVWTQLAEAAPLKVALRLEPSDVARTAQVLRGIKLNLGKSLEGAQAIALSVSGSNGAAPAAPLRFAVVLECADEAAARDLAARLQAQTRGIALQVALRAFGFGGVLNSLALEAQGAQLRLRLDLSRDDMTRLRGMLAR